MIDAAAEAEAIADWKAGDRRAGDTLLRMHAGLIFAAVRRYVSDHCELDDLVQMGRIALLDAATRYDPTGAKFSTFAYRGVWWSAREFARAGRYIVPGAEPGRRKRDAHMFAERLEDPAGNGVTLLDRIAAPAPEETSEVDVVMLLDSLPANQRDVIELHYGPSPLTLDEIGETRGITKQAAHAAKDRALARLRAASGIVSDKCTSKHNAARAKRREARGLAAKCCALCKGEYPHRHNRRTCPLRQAA